MSKCGKCNNCKNWQNVKFANGRGREILLPIVVNIGRLVTYCCVCGCGGMWKSILHIVNMQNYKNKQTSVNGSGTNWSIASGSGGITGLLLICYPGWWLLMMSEWVSECVCLICFHNIFLLLMSLTCVHIWFDVMWRENRWRCLATLNVDI